MSQYENEDFCDWIGKRVCSKGEQFGTLKFFGQTSFSEGLWCGIALDNPFGKNDGMVKGIRYFHCEPKFGIFVPSSKVVKIKESVIKAASDDGLNETYKISNNGSNKSELNPDVTVGIIVKPSETNENEVDSNVESEESLGILNPDLIENLEESLNSSFEKSLIGQMSSNNEIIEEPVFTKQPLNIESNFSESIEFPLYASTPRLPHKRLSMFSNDYESYDCNDPSEVYFDIEKFIDQPNLSSTSKSLKLSNVPVVSISSNEFLNKTKAVKTDNLISKCRLSNILECSNSFDLSKADDAQNISVKNTEISLESFKVPLNATFDKLASCVQNLSIEERVNPVNISININENSLESTFVVKNFITDSELAIKSVDIPINSTFEKETHDCVQNFSIKEKSENISTEIKENSLENTFVINAVQCKELNKSQPNNTVVMESKKFADNSIPETSKLNITQEIGKIKDIKQDSGNLNNVKKTGTRISKLFIKPPSKEKMSIKPTCEIAPRRHSTQYSLNSFKTELKTNELNSLSSPVTKKQINITNQKDKDGLKIKKLNCLSDALKQVNRANQENKLSKIYSKTLPAPKLMCDKSIKVRSTFQSKFQKTHEDASDNKTKCFIKPLNGNILNRKKSDNFVGVDVNIAGQSIERRHSLNAGLKDKPVIRPRYSMLPRVFKTEQNTVSKAKDSISKKVQSPVSSVVSSAREIKLPSKKPIEKNATSKLKRPGWNGKM